MEEIPKSTKKHMPDWEYVLMTDEDNGHSFKNIFQVFCQLIYCLKTYLLDMFFNYFCDILTLQMNGLLVYSNLQNGHLLSGLYLRILILVLSSDSISVLHFMTL